MTLVATATMVVICVLGVMMALAGLRQQRAEYQREAMIAEAVRVSDNVRLNGPPHVLSGGVSEAAQLFDADGRLIASSPDLKGLHEPMMSDADNGGISYTTQERCNLPAFPGTCVIVLKFPIHLRDGTWELYSATKAPVWYGHPAQLLALILGGLLLVAITAAGTHLIVSRTLAPVAAISGKLAKITESDLTHRVPMPKYSDELHELAQVTNRTLDRAQSAVEQQLRFASDASHDLRSPLTAMRTQIEQALMYPEETDWPKTADMLLGSVERLQHLVADLLQMSRLDAGYARPPEVVDLTGLVRCELDRRPRGVEVVRRLTDGVTVMGDRIGLSRLLTNLLDNAERHAESAVTVTVARRPGDQAEQAVLEVADDGEGIPRHLREEVFRRFVRLKASRLRDSGGTGLGLPIARQIAEAHGGTLTIEDSPRGACFVLRLPLHDSERSLP
ncbi:sensor histidine kinase [Nonomuraea phyllanthi]|uniref:sensor histidine kinase n=1 Tax=Nonomuraea phyllanthi TaxID=2219224 RepID=UPI00186B3DED|nr:HAMP domain-containing sensor histidine kinase [Nonomuraea phyllanthi]